MTLAFTLEKVAVALNKKERRRQALQFAALGAVSTPAIDAVKNLVQKGTPLPKEVRPVRWALGSMAAGSMLGFLPTIRHQLERNIQTKASKRVHRNHQRAMKKTGQVGVGAVLGKMVTPTMQQRAINAGVGAAFGALLGPAAATFTGNQEADKDTLQRDMAAGAIGGAIGSLVSAGGLSVGGSAVGGAVGGFIAGLFDKPKKASVSGQDLRTPVMGGTKFPTQDSIRPAQRRLNQASAEVGPQPASTFSAIGQMKKVKVAGLGDDMDPMLDDPLVLFLKQANDKVHEDAKESPPLSGLLQHGNELKDNLEDMPKGKEEHEVTSKPPGPTKSMIPSTPCEYLEEKFENSRSMRKKLYEKDHEFKGFDQGVIDRILGL